MKFSSSSQIQCPEKDCSYRFTSVQNRDIETIPVNSALREIIASTVKWGMCREHNEELRLVCINDDCRICDDCKHEGVHKDHKVIQMKNIEKQAETKKNFLEQTLQQLEEYEDEVSSLLEKKREMLTSNIKFRFRALKSFLSLKEEQLLDEAEKMFRLEKAKLDNGVGSKSLIKQNLREYIEKYTDIYGAENPMRLLNSDLSKLTRELDKQTLTNYSQRIQSTFQEEFKNLDEILLSLGKDIVQVEFPSERISKQTFSSYLIRDQNLNLIPEYLNKNQGKCSQVKFAVNPNREDSLIIYSQAGEGANHAEQPENNNQDEIELLNQKEAVFNIKKETLEGMNLLHILQAKEKMKEMKNLRVNFIAKKLKDYEFENCYPFLFWNVKSLEGLSVSLDFCDLLDEQSIAAFLKNTLPHISKDSLKALELNLNNTRITDSTLLTLNQSFDHLKNKLEYFGILLNQTRVDDLRTSELFTTPMPNLKVLKLGLQGTKIAECTMQALASNILQNTNFLEVLDLSFKKTFISDEDVTLLFQKLRPPLKKLVLNFSDTYLGDKCIEAFMKQAFSELHCLKALEINLSNTTVSDLSITHLLRSIFNLQKFVIVLKNTNITNKSIQAFRNNQLLKNTLQEWDVIVDQSMTNEAFNDLKGKIPDGAVPDEMEVESQGV